MDRTGVDPPQRPRARSLGIAPGLYPTGTANAVTDVGGVRVGQVTLIEGDDIRTGVTAILPHAGNLFQDKVPAGLAVGNGFGKLTGVTQLVELGEIETPVVLTNTLAVPRAADAVLDWTLAQPGNEEVGSVNPVVGETNDGRLNDIRRRVVTPEVVLRAIDAACGGPVREGVAGAGTGTMAFGWKGGIGTSSRVLPEERGGYTVGVLVQSNFGGVLRVLGVPVGQLLKPADSADEAAPRASPGSIMMIVATDAPLSDRNLTRLARRALAGLARTGASMSNGSGDYVISFSTSVDVRRTAARRSRVSSVQDLPNARASPLFQAAIEATEEAIYNSLFVAATVAGYRGRTARALPVDECIELVRAGRSG